MKPTPLVWQSDPLSFLFEMRQAKHIRSHFFLKYSSLTWSYFQQVQLIKN